MAVLYRDEIIIDALPYARGDDRTVLIGALGSSRGETGVALLRHVLTETGPATGHNRAVALAALAGRIGGDGTPLYVEALNDRSAPLQITAVMALAENGDDRATDQVMAWLTRKLRRKNRLASWDPREVPAPITFAARNHCLPRVAVVLQDNLSRLHPDERHRLASAWPEVAERRAGDQPPAPDATRLEAWLYEAGGRPENDQPEDVSTLSDRCVQESLARAQRRAARAGFHCQRQ